jgi:hypothetical protein
MAQLPVANLTQVAVAPLPLAEYTSVGTQCTLSTSGCVGRVLGQIEQTAGTVVRRTGNGESLSRLPANAGEAHR